MKGDHEWSAIDATLIHWFYLTISKDLIHTVVANDDDACSLWNKINGLFTDNDKLQRLVFLSRSSLGVIKTTPPSMTNACI